jgi:two-component sensor histidine kinase
MRISLNRREQKRAITFLIFVSVSLWILGIYVLHTSPTLSFDLGFTLSTIEHNIQKIDDIELNPAFFNKLPEFFTPKQEASWWQMQEMIYKVLKEKDSVVVSFMEKDGVTREIKVSIVRMSLSEIMKMTGLVYLVALIYLLSAILVFQRHRSTSGSVLTFFLLFGSLYLTSSAPVASRSITLDPFYFKILVDFIYISAGGLITFVHFAFVFPREKGILKRYPWISYIFYGFFFLTVIFYLSGIIAFGSTFPFLCFWTFVMIGAFIHSLITEKDTFFRRQITLSLIAPTIVGGFFIFFYIFPGVIGIKSLGITYFALFSLILPFALPSAMDNLRLYQERLEMEKSSQREKEQICQALHDNIGNDLMNIRLLSEIASRSLSSNSEKMGNIIHSIKQTALINMERLKEFLWAVNIEEEDSIDDVISYFKSYARRFLAPSNIEIEFKTPYASRIPHLSPSIRFNLFNIYKEALTNIIKYSKAKKVEVELSIKEEGLKMRIADDGVGFTPEHIPKGCYGVKNMKKRAEEMGGVLKIFSKEGKGTEIYLALPSKYPV